MKKIINAFKIWRRKPYKLAICRAFEQGKINSKQLHELAAMIDGA